MQVAEDVSAQCKETGDRKPSWVIMLDMPGKIGDQISDTVDQTLQVRLLLAIRSVTLSQVRLLS